jgi:hypothetical protein
MRPRRTAGDKKHKQNQFQNIAATATTNIQTCTWYGVRVESCPSYKQETQKAQKRGW